MKFVKMQGAGNDYVYVDCFKYKVNDPKKVARIVSDRHFGVGADGLILVCPSDVADVRMDMYNADGSRGKMCGNGSRCVAKFAYDRGYVKKEEFELETLAGIRKISLEAENNKAKSITVDMGSPKLYSKLPEPIFINGIEKEFIGVNMGNPHAVYFVKSLEELNSLDLEKIGYFFENHERFAPDKVNSEFIYVENDENIHMRVWERGSGETLACGTGASASAYACILSNLCKDTINVYLRGGQLKIAYDRISDSIFMTGEAVEVFTGEIDIAGEE